MTTPALAENVKGKGRHYKHPVTGELLPSITNVLGAAVNKPALHAGLPRSSQSRRLPCATPCRTSTKKRPSRF